MYPFPKGKPSLLKAEKLNLLREVKELQSPKVSSLSEEKGRSYQDSPINGHDRIVKTLP